MSLNNNRKIDKVVRKIRKKLLFHVNDKGYRFQFYDEMKDYCRYLMIGTPKKGESAYWIFKIISKIINKVYKIAGFTH